MEWSRPEFLYLILPLAAAWLALALYARRKRRRAAAAFVAQAMWPKILPADSRSRFWVKLLLREMALIAGLVALGGPRFGTQYEEVIPRGSDLYILIDVSRSMLAEDVPPSRLGRAKADVASLVNRLEGERVGLIAFAGQAVVKCPLTVDYDSFRRSLDELDPGSAPRGGTAIGDAIRKALEVFQAKAERDQAILLITDGDDQQSYPLEAASVAAERQVTIFTVGLGDADHGARVPKGGQTPAYVEYQGQQVWSKLDGSLLKEIALKTSGVYIPVGTRSYDLGELYADHLKGRRGGDDETRKRLRRSEQFQIFLALALFALLADLLISASPMLEQRSPSGSAQRSVHDVKKRGREEDQETRRQGDKERKGITAGSYLVSPCLPLSLSPCLISILSTCTALLIVALPFGAARADDPTADVREGLQLYRQDEFEKARDKFAAARQAFDKGEAGKAAIAAFDEACAAHRKGDVAQARESYLQAGLAHDKKLAAAAHFNLGTLAAEEARRLAGEHPEQVPPDKRQEILDQLKGAVASFRHCLELQPDNSRARHDIELVRQWIRYYSGKWHERDRQKRREEANLVAFLEFLIETQRGLRESVKSLPATTSADAFAELKRLQDELLDEIEPLKEKIRADLQPAQPPGGNQQAASSQELDQGIKMLQEWAESAGEKMSSAARRLGSRQPAPATADQQSAIDELEKIWDAVIPFPALLTRDLADQTQIVRSLEPEPGADSKSEKDEAAKSENLDADDAPPAAPGPGLNAGHQALGSLSEDLTQLTELQEQTRRRTQLLKLKAETELARLEKSPPAEAAEPTDESQPKGVDPEQVKAGYQKAIDLVPRAVEKMGATIQSLKKKAGPAAYPTAEEARKILEEIQQAQPKNEQKQDKQQDQDQKDDKKKDDQKKTEEQKKDEKNDEKNKDEQQKKDDEKSDGKKLEEQKKQDDQAKPGEKKENQKQPQVSRDQIEEALRKVRERQQEKRERDRKLKARTSGKVPVDKDW
jgi:Ca-activated chloride channel family protein